ncbi:MAG: 4-hydroxyacetophenone monooxygenase, partial [Deltaproteobacteria bacterium]|nr:4-hydroxyacetophenone monooxygenase [Deltaproteobacteria bacterium]
IECQTGYIVQCVEAIRARRLKYLDLRSEAMTRFNNKLRGELERTAWAKTGKSWYKNEAGVITNNWSGTTTRYWW